MCSCSVKLLCQIVCWTGLPSWPWHRGVKTVHMQIHTVCWKAKCVFCSSELSLGFWLRYKLDSRNWSMYQNTIAPEKNRWEWLQFLWIQKDTSPAGKYYPLIIDDIFLIALMSMKAYAARASVKIKLNKNWILWRPAESVGWTTPFLILQFSVNHHTVGFYVQIMLFIKVSRTVKFKKPFFMLLRCWPLDLILEDGKSFAVMWKYERNMESFRFAWQVLDKGDVSVRKMSLTDWGKRRVMTWMIWGCSSCYLKPVEGVCKIHVAINHCSCSNYQGPSVKNIIDSFVKESQWIPAKNLDWWFNGWEIQNIESECQRV